MTLHPPGTDPEITELLNGWSSGDKEALENLMRVVYSRLRRLAASCLQGERSDHTLQPTALVHEAFLRLSKQRISGWRNRSQFFALASSMMRRILVDYARSRSAAKRGGGCSFLNLDDELRHPQVEFSLQVLALDSALSKLAEEDPKAVKLVELLYFAGLNVREAAIALGTSERTVKRRWKAVKLWLYHRLKQGGENVA